MADQQMEIAYYSNDFLADAVFFARFGGPVSADGRDRTWEAQNMGS
jgi:hypothetical protein